MHISFNYFILHIYTYNLQFTQVRQFNRITSTRS